MKSSPKAVIASALAATVLAPLCAVGAPNGVALTMLPLADSYAANEARAISPDGLWVSGFMGSGAMSYSAGVSAGYLYDVVTGTIYCPVIDSTPSAYAGTLTGVCRRMENGTNEVIVSGAGGGNPQWYMTFDGGTNWAGKFRDSRGAVPSIPSANAVAGTASDYFYTTWTDQNPSGYQLYVGQSLGSWTSVTNWIKKGIPNGLKAGLDSVSATGRAVGYRWLTDKFYKHNYVVDYNTPGGSGSPVFNFYGLAGTYEGEAFCVSADGNTIFGRSPIVTLAANLYGYKVTFSGPYATNGVTQATTNQLPNFADVPLDSVALATPYGCTPDGKYAVGMNYRSMEKAVVWNTSDADTNKWTVLDLTELAKLFGLAEGFDGNLRRAFSVGTNANGLVVAGTGVSVGVARAFIMTVPLPVSPQLTIANQGGWFQINYLGLGNATNVLECTTNLSLPTTWIPLDTNTSGALSTYNDYSTSDVQKYYRVQLQ